MRLLLVEDDVPLVSFMRKGLETEGYTADVLHSGDKVLDKIATNSYNLLILDLNLPGMDGTQVLRKVREMKQELPVLVLTARSKVEDRVSVLDSGADDYLIKPFSFSELSARIRALMRRQILAHEPLLRYGDLELNRAERQVRRGGRKIELTAKEYALLEYLLRNSGRHVTRSMIMENVWNLSFDTMTNVVDVYINYLRKKVDGDTGPKLIHTVRGVGYQLGESLDTGVPEPSEPVSPSPGSRP